jgi:hypothetical protein
LLWQLLKSAVITIDASHLTWLFLATISALATAFVWMFCEVERRFGKRLNALAAARISHLRDREGRRKANRRD